MTTLGRRFVFAVSLLSLAACGGDPPPPAEAPPAPTPAPAPAPEPAPSSSAAPAPSGSAAAEAPKSTGSGRPPILKTSESEITDTFGSSPAARLELGDKEIATLRIPENALSGG